MSLFDKLRQLKNYDSVIAQKNQIILQREQQIQNQTKTIDDLNKETEEARQERDRVIQQQAKILDELKKETEDARQAKLTAESERDAQLEKTKIACEKLIESYAQQTDEARSIYEQGQKVYDELKAEYDASAKELALTKEKIKLLKSFLRKSYGAIEDGQPIDMSKVNKLCPTAVLSLNSFDVKDLRALMKENEKLINALLLKYESKYTTKVNKTIYQLMVLAVRAELQNILTELKYSNLEKCKNDLNEMFAKLLNIVLDGNQQIAPTIKSFISEARILFDQTVDIEYQYYIRREQEKAEQQALKEQMRQEAEERRALAIEKEKIEREENKFKAEISSTEEKLANCKDDEQIQKLLARIEELQKFLEAVEDKKEDIINRQNGKAGVVYVISNLGSFGDNTFKIGMTRRSEPMERVRELGDASVPFSFDVHSFIFSDDAVGLETELHHRLNARRTNKINLRKEFFDISIDELEKLVNEICPTAEFKRTMLAIEYRKGLEMANREMLS